MYITTVSGDVLHTYASCQFLFSFFIAVYKVIEVQAYMHIPYYRVYSICGVGTLLSFPETVRSNDCCRLPLTNLPSLNRPKILNLALSLFLLNWLAIGKDMID